MNLKANFSNNVPVFIEINHRLFYVKLNSPTFPDFQKKWLARGYFYSTVM